MYYRVEHRKKKGIGTLKNYASIISGLAALALAILFISTIIISGQSSQLSNIVGSFAAAPASGFTASAASCSGVTITTGQTAAPGKYRLQVLKETTTVFTSPEFTFPNNKSASQEIAFKPELKEDASYRFVLTSGNVIQTLSNNTFNAQCDQHTFNITVETVCREGTGYSRKYRSAQYNAYHALFYNKNTGNYNTLTDRKNGVYDNFGNKGDASTYRIESRFVLAAGNHIPMTIVPKPGSPLPSAFTVDASKGNVSWTRSAVPSGTYSYYAILPDNECPSNRSSSPSAVVVPTPTIPNPPLPISCVNKDIMIVMDTSGSMSSKEINDAKSAVKALVSRLPSNEGVQAGVVGFGTRPYDVADMTTSLMNIPQALNSLKASGGTNIAGGITLGASKMDPDNRTHVILLFTDGLANVPRESKIGPNDQAAYTSAQAAATAAVKAEIERGLKPVFYSVGLGSRSQLNAAWLDTLASGTGGKSIYVSKSSDLEGIFASLSADICKETPSFAAPDFLNRVAPPTK